MKRVMVMLYGLVCYGIFLATFLYAIAWTGNILVPNSIDSAPSTSFWYAVLINAGLLAVFAIQHSLMARPFFKKWLTRFIPEPAELLFGHLRCLGFVVLALAADGCSDLAFHTPSSRWNSLDCFRSRLVDDPDFDIPDQSL